MIKKNKKHQKHIELNTNKITYFKSWIDITVRVKSFWVALGNSKCRGGSKNGEREISHILKVLGQLVVNAAIKPAAVHSWHRRRPLDICQCSLIIVMLSCYKVILGFLNEKLFSLSVYFSGEKNKHENESVSRKTINIDTSFCNWFVK